MKKYYVSQHFCGNVGFDIEAETEEEAEEKFNELMLKLDNNDFCQLAGFDDGEITIEVQS
jgi:hypothetical protein